MDNTAYLPTVTTDKVWLSNGTQATDYMSLLDAETGYLFGIVSKHYRVLQHQDAMDRVEDVISRHPEYGRWEREVQTWNNGGKMKVVYSFPEVMVSVGKEDLIHPTINMYNSHDGTWSFRVLFGAFRLICTNGLVIGDKVLDYKKSHINNVEQIFTMDLLGDAMDGFSNQRLIWETWVDRIIDTPEAKAKVEDLGFTETETRDLQEDVEISSGESLENVRVISLWVLYNLVCQYLTHRVRSEQRRLAIEARLRGW